MDEVTADLEKLVTDLKAAEAQLVSDGKTLEAALLRVVTAQFEAVKNEIQNLISHL